jgi:hypothetical protein
VLLSVSTLLASRTRWMGATPAPGAGSGGKRCPSAAARWPCCAGVSAPDSKVACVLGGLVSASQFEVIGERGLGLAFLLGTSSVKRVA